MASNVPEHWRASSWEEKARENPLYAIMTQERMNNAGDTDFSLECLEEFFGKGVTLFSTHIEPLLSARGGNPADTLCLEYGCGAGRILKAVSAAGYRCAGIDIAPTMLEHCRRLVPEVETLYAIDSAGGCGVDPGCASLVYSYAVVQHIGSLENYTRAFDIMCRALAPGGTLAVQVNCEDFAHGDIEIPWRTENHEDHSLHFRPGEDKPYYKHAQDNWSGVYIGYHNLVNILARHGVTLQSRYFHNPKKLRAVWFIGHKAG